MLLFIWNDEKNRGNIRKHGLGFEDVKSVFDDPNHLSRQDRHVGGEERWQTMGRLSEAVVVIVAHTVNDDNGREIIRIISARKAPRRESAVYYAKLSVRQVLQ